MITPLPAPIALHLLQRRNAERAEEERKRRRVEEERRRPAVDHAGVIHGLTAARYGDWGVKE